jgi:separase
MNAFFRSHHSSSELFIYCGHGTGDKLCDTYKFRKWEVPAAMLWGCSSGRLSIQGVHDPAGAVLNYLIGGAPFVVANLWDVTDRDIDRLSVDCMKRVFDSDTATAADNSNSSARMPNHRNCPSSVNSLGSAVAAARTVCKLKNAVGSAAVLYGLPVSLTSN